VGDAGTLAVFTDAAGGARFSVWQAGRHGGAELVNAPGALTMNELDTRDFHGATRFYGDVFGWTVEPIEQDGQAVYGSVKLDGRLVAGMLPMGPQFPAESPPHWVPYFGVEDLDGSAAKAEELGGRVLMGPIKVPAGRFVVLLDPHGANLCISQSSYDPPPGS
jgi:predicted enzyme related to lactoylglutathione lyase